MAAQAASGGGWGKMPKRSASRIMRRVTAPAPNLSPAIHTCMHGMIELVGCIGISCHDGVQRVIAVLPTHPVLSLAASLIPIASLKHMLALCHTAINPSMDTNRYMHWLYRHVLGTCQPVISETVVPEHIHAGCQLRTRYPGSSAAASANVAPFHRPNVNVAWPFSHLNNRWGSTYNP